MKKSVCVICALLACLFAAAVQADMEIHFLDVGEADAAIVVCDGEVMVVDAGEAGSGQFLYAYLNNFRCYTLSSYETNKEEYDGEAYQYF